MIDDLELVLTEARRNSLTRDNPSLSDLPAWFQELRPHQRVAVREVLTAYEEGAECVVVDAPTGCLAGDTEIVVNRGGNAKRHPISKLVSSFNGQTDRMGKKWDLSIPTNIQCANDDFVRLSKLENAWSSGVRPTYTVTSKSGSIRSTLEHPFLTPDGFKVLDDLKPSDLVAVRGERVRKPTQAKKYYQFEARLYHHPYASNKRTYSKGTDGWRIPTHRLIMEAILNGISYQDFTAKCMMGDIEGLKFLDPAVDAVHHKDGNSLNNDPSNLEVLPHLEHWAMEGREKTWRNCGFPVVFEPIDNIDYYGEEETYDLRLAEEPHNFVANGYVVHNSGKTILAEVVRRLLPGARQTSYICSSKALQSQFLTDYPYAKVLKGRSNYATERYPERFGNQRDSLTCADCTKSPGDSESCLWCSHTSVCPYEQAKCAALSSRLSVLNTAYFLSECNGPGRFSRGGLVIADEADTLESELMSHVEVRISERRLKQYGLGTPKFVTKEESWREWAEVAYEKVRNTRLPVSSHDEVKALREHKRHGLLVERLKGLADEIAQGGMVFTGDRNHVAFKPVTVSAYGQEKLWRHGDKWLLMSATVISADELLESLGWDDEKDWRLVKVPSTFKPENRRVVVWPVASMTWKNKENAEPKLVEGVKEIVRRHPDERILIHSTSYALTKRIVQGLKDLPAELAGNTIISDNVIPGYEFAGNGACTFTPVCSPPCSNVDPLSDLRPVFTYSTSSEKDSALAAYLREDRAILVAPSMDRGIDLPGDACRVQIICKVPFLSLQDKQVSARLYGTGRAGKTWYAVNAIRTLIQMSGRGVRHSEDFCTTYILDRQFVDNIWSQHKRLVPAWWAKGLEWRMHGLPKM